MQVELSPRDLAQLLAALRNWQLDSLNEDLPEAFAGHFEAQFQKDVPTKTLT